MNFKDLFVPRYLHSDPEVRLNVIRNTEDVKLLQSMAERDRDPSVRKAAADRAEMLMVGRHQTA